MNPDETLAKYASRHKPPVTRQELWQALCAALRERDKWHATAANLEQIQLCLQARLNTAEPDAKRYRLLRNEMGLEWSRARYVVVTIPKWVFTAPIKHGQSQNDTIDTAIDAALAQDGGQP